MRPNPEDAKNYDTKRIRRDFRSRRYSADEVNMVYSDVRPHFRRRCSHAGQARSSKLEAIDPLKAPYFPDPSRNGASSTSAARASSRSAARASNSTIRRPPLPGPGDREVTFESVDAAKPAKFYFNSTTAHRNYPDKR